MALFKKSDEEKRENHTNRNTPQQDQTDGVKTKLSIHPDWELTNQEKYVYQFKHEQLPLLQPNQISITGIRLLEYNDGFVVVAFLRNTLSSGIKFDGVDLLLLDETDQPIAKKQFELDGLGELPAHSARPWRFLFSNEDKLVEKIPKDSWKIAFDLKFERPKHQLELDEAWEKEISPLQKEELEKLVSDLPKLKPGEINFVGINVEFTPDEDLSSTVLIRNGRDKNIQLQQIPLIIEDAEGDIVCQGLFQFEDFEVSANTSKPWTFIFPKNLVKKFNPDLSSWKVYPPESKS